MSVTAVTALEPWLDKKGIAEHLACSPRWIEDRVSEGMPSAMIAGRRKFRVSEAEPWLERAGHIRREA
jgi:hypothetical protein